MRRFGIDRNERSGTKVEETLRLYSLDDTLREDMLSTPEHHAASAQAPLSPIGIGTYLGESSEVDDERYVGILNNAIRLGVRLIDTAINYRGQRSERIVGRVLAKNGGFLL